MKRIIIILIIFSFLVIGCTKKASIDNTNYNELMNKITKDESFVLAIINDKDKEYKEFNNNLNKIVKDYNINVTYININKLDNKEIKEIKKIVNYDKTPTLAFIKEGIEDNSNNRIIGNISVDRMIEIFRNAEYID